MDDNVWMNETNGWMSFAWLTNLPNTVKDALVSCEKRKGHGTCLG